MIAQDTYVIRRSAESSYIDNALRELEGYNKTISIFRLLSLGLPTLEGLVILRWNDRVPKEISDSFEGKRIPEVLVRTDKVREAGRYMRGGYLVPLDQVEAEVRRVLGIGRIIVLLEPRSKYDNLYGINVLIDFTADQACVEIVGPGFDVSDLNRGDISPHERLWLSIDEEQIKPRIRKRSLVSHEQYRASVQHRLAKIGHDAMRLGWTTSVPTSNTEWVELGKKFIKTRGETLLLEQQNYIPLPRHLFWKLIRYIRNVPWQIQQFANRERECVLSTSIMNRSEEIIFWDIVLPSKKYFIA
jgi:hypothetical protein